jgi:hypothetical protein
MTLWPIPTAGSALGQGDKAKGSRPVPTVACPGSVRLSFGPIPGTAPTCAARQRQAVRGTVSSLCYQRVGPVSFTSSSGQAAGHGPRNGAHDWVPAQLRQRPVNIRTSTI